MASTAVAQSESWDSGASLGLEFDPSGRIIDFLDHSVTRRDTPEERVRQYYARVLVEEYAYPADRIALEVPINIGSETKFADIAVFSSAAAKAKKDQGRIVLVVETKAPTKKAGLRQLTSYVFPSSAQGGVWTNGAEAAYFRRVEKPQLELREWTNIPRHGETWDTVGNYKKSQLRPPRNLKQVFQRCHNAIYRAGLDSEDVALDMVRIILAKYQDEQNVGEVAQFRCTPEEFSTPAGRKAVADRVHQLFAQVASTYQGVFHHGEVITIGDDNLAVVVNELQPFRFLADDETEEVYDVIGTAFEVYVASHLKGARGQYFTNRLVVNMMVDILDPDENSVLLDPACGSGGFLIAAFRHVRRKIMSSARSKTAKGRALKDAATRIFGFDISPKLVRVAKTNMILNGDGHGGITQANTLRPLAEGLPRGFRLDIGGTGDGHVATHILTNPPFGAGHDVREKNPAVLPQFDLGHVWQADDNGWLHPTSAINDGEGVPPEILFLERSIQLLAPGGRLAIVIARGVLDNREALAARHYILRHTRLLGVINCHPNTFAPFNGTKASIIIVEKKSSPGFQRNEDYPVFMAISQRVGQDSLGREIFKRDANGELVLVDGEPVPDHDLDMVAKAWRSFEAGNDIEYEAAWTVPLSRIIKAQDARINPTRYAPEAEQALAQVLELADSSEWSVERLGDFATIFNGPRFKRPYADPGVEAGDGILRMYTPKAFFEERGESAKYLDLNKASRTQKRQLEVLTLKRNWILVVDSGTAGKLLGRVGMTSAVHDGTIGNNNMIRVIIDDPERRDYVYQFLRSELGQALLLRNVYGTNQDHIEPDDVKDIAVPIPRDREKMAAVYKRVRQVLELRERAAEVDEDATAEVEGLLGGALDQAQPETEY